MLVYEFSCNCGHSFELFSAKPNNFYGMVCPKCKASDLQIQQKKLVEAKKASDFTEKEKIAKFDKIHEVLLNHFNEVMDKNTEEADIEEMLYVLVTEEWLGKEAAKELY